MDLMTQLVAHSEMISNFFSNCITHSLDSNVIKRFVFTCYFTFMCSANHQSSYDYDSSVLTRSKQNNDIVRTLVKSEI